MIYLWYIGLSRTQISLLSNVSIKAVRHTLKYALQKILDFKNNNDFKVGGPGIIVEIDESKFGKRKYNRGHKVGGIWVIGVVERTLERKIALEIIKERTIENINAFILRNVRPGSIIYSDKWPGYDGLFELGYRHLDVNHSKNFVDPITRCHTNTIEGNWSGIKVLIPKRHRTEKLITIHLILFMFKRKFDGRNFKGLIKILLN